MDIEHDTNIQLTRIDRELLNNYQQEFPLVDRPYRVLADKLGLDEEMVINRLDMMKKHGYISRIGPVFKCNTLGVSTLVAMSVPDEELEQVAGIVNQLPEVNHNYERDHKFNLWFVMAAADVKGLEKLIEKIEIKTGYPCLNLPLLEDFHIDLGFELQWT